MVGCSGYTMNFDYLRIWAISSGWRTTRGASPLIVERYRRLLQNLGIERALGLVLNGQVCDNLV